MQHTVSGQLHSYEAYIPEDVVVVLGGVNGAAWRVHLGEEDEPAKVVDMSTAKSYEMNVQDLHWPAETPILSATLDGQDRVLQYFGSSGEGFELAFLGSYQHVIVRTLQEQALSEHLLPPIVMDSSKMLQCPMPGAVVSIMVREGQLVEEGQQLAIVEAMKMQNVLRAERSTKVTKILCKAGDTLKVDQTMMEFEALVT
jgi:propionyl-CoA carboxylase alpha chain